MGYNCVNSFEMCEIGQAVWDENLMDFSYFRSGSHLVFLCNIIILIEVTFVVFLIRPNKKN